MSSRFGMEVYKFGVFITLPIVTVLYFNRPEIMERVIANLRYVTYPAEGPRPATGDLDSVKRALERSKGQTSADGSNSKK